MAEAELRSALQLAVDAITYAREPHHLNHAEECGSLCPVAADQLDLALDKGRAALRSVDTNEEAANG